MNMRVQNIVDIANALDAFVNCISDSEISFDDLVELGPICGGLDVIKNWVQPGLFIDTVDDCTAPISVNGITPSISAEPTSEGTTRIGELKYSDELIHRVSKYIRDTYADKGKLNFSKMTRDTINTLDLSMSFSYLRAVLNGRIRTDITGEYFIKKGLTLESVNK